MSLIRSLSYILGYLIRGVSFFIFLRIKINFKLVKKNMVSILQEIDIAHVFNHFAQKRCITHPKRKASSVCLHEDCWKSESDKAFFCEDCNVDHVMKHLNFARFDALFTDELFYEFDDFANKNQNTKEKSKERIRKFEHKINELHIEIEQWTRCQFAELKRLFENHLIATDSFEVIKNLKKMLSDARIELCLNYELKEKVKIYCTQIQNIQNNLNEHVISEKKNDQMDEKLNLKLQNMANNIQENVKNQINQLTEYLIDSKKKSKSTQNQFLVEEEPYPKLSNASILVHKIPIVKKYSNEDYNRLKMIN